MFSSRNKVTGITAGCWDLLHAGHVLMFEECKSQCDFLIVLLQTNPHIDRVSKNVPVQSLYERQIQVRACNSRDHGFSTSSLRKRIYEAENGKI